MEQNTQQEINKPQLSPPAGGFGLEINSQFANQQTADPFSKNLQLKEGLRQIKINDPKYNIEYYCSNFVKTTKYNIFSFLPLSILYQYKKVANCYFLLQSVLSCTELSPWDPITQIFPTILVLSISIIREGIEDFLRYQTDKISNQQPVHRVMTDGSLEATTSGQILVGDVLFVADDEDIPADLVLIGGGIKHESGGLNSIINKTGSTSLDGSVIQADEQSVCYLQTSSLDGEKNLKKRVTPKNFRGIDPERINRTKGFNKSFPEINGFIDCDEPNNDLTQFHGTLRLKSINNKTYSLGPQQILLKGSKLINSVRGVLGIVVYTGIDTKVMQNQHNCRYKMSKVEKETNKTVVRLLILHTMICVVLAWQEYRWRTTMADSNYYLYNLKQEGKPSDDVFKQFIFSFGTSFLLNSTFIPISMIVSVEIVKFLQGLFIGYDFEMMTIKFDEDDIQVQSNDQEYNIQMPQKAKNPISFQQCKVQTCSLNEELGQVKYIFSDKTGTLTMNSMEFRLCKIGNQIYGDQTSRAYIGPKQIGEPLEEHQMNQTPLNSAIRKVKKKDRDLADEEYIDSSSNSHLSQLSVRSSVNKKQGASYNYHNLQLENILFGVQNESEQCIQEQLKCNLTINSKPGKTSLVFSDQKQLINEFLQCLATTHECVAEMKKVKMGNKMVDVIGYQGPSPDEVALLEFAQQHGYEFIKSTDESMQVNKKYKVYNNMSMTSFNQKPNLDEMPHEWKTEKVLDFKLLKKMEFSSDRKRMSIVVQDMQDKKFKLYCKGADNIIKQRLREGYIPASKRKGLQMFHDMDMQKLKINDPENDDVKMMVDTDQFLEQSSMEGFRTLLVGMRILDESEAIAFQEELIKAENDILFRDKNIAKIFDKWENELSLIGATVLDDKLQDNVQDTIQSLHKADIKVWVLTGDKLETAESIGFSCKLLTREMEIYRVRTHDDVVNLFNRENAKQNEIDILNGQKKALIIEADALKKILGEEDLKLQRWFLKITKSLETVLCCRVSPSQKAEVVKLIKNDDSEVITLAIGDGANDVSMILEADVGVGLFGNEGLRAVDNSDYAVAEFRHLWTLLFKQGRWQYHRVCMLVIYSIYKSFLYTILQVLFARVNGFSLQTVFPDFFLTMFNLQFTAWPIPFYACIDLDLYPSTDNSKVKDPLLEFEAYDPSHLREYLPNLYFPGQRNVSFNQLVFMWWAIRGLYEALVAFFVTQEVFSHGILNRDGQTGDLWSFGICLFTMILCIMHFKLLLKHRVINWIIPSVYLILSLAVYLLYLYVTDNWQMFKNHHTFELLFTSPVFYLTVFLGSAVCFLIDFMLESVGQNIFTDTRDLLRQQALLHGGELTEEFEREFKEYNQYQKFLGINQDEVREQHLDYKRAIYAGYTEEELNEEQRLNKLIQKDMKNFRSMSQGGSDITAKITNMIQRFTQQRGQHGIPLGPRRVKEKEQDTKMGLRQNLQTNDQMSSKAKFKENELGEQAMHVLAGQREFGLMSRNRVRSIAENQIDKTNMQDNEGTAEVLMEFDQQEQRVDMVKNLGVKRDKQPVKRAPNQISPLKEQSIEIQELKSINKTEYADISGTSTPEKNYLMKVPSPRQHVLIEENKSPNNTIEESQIGRLQPHASHSSVGAKAQGASLRVSNSIQLNAVGAAENGAVALDLSTRNRFRSGGADIQDQILQIDCFNKSSSLRSQKNAASSRHNKKMSIVSSFSVVGADYNRIDEEEFKPNPQILSGQVRTQRKLAELPIEEPLSRRDVPERDSKQVLMLKKSPNTLNE